MCNDDSGSSLGESDKRKCDSQKHTPLLLQSSVVGVLDYQSFVPFQVDRLDFNVESNVHGCDDLVLHLGATECGDALEFFLLLGLGCAGARSTGL